MVKIMNQNIVIVSAKDMALRSEKSKRVKLERLQYEIDLAFENTLAEIEGRIESAADRGERSITYCFRNRDCAVSKVDFIYWNEIGEHLIDVLRNNGYTANFFNNELCKKEIQLEIIIEW